MASFSGPLRHRLRAAAACALLLASACARADGEHVFWEVAGRHNTVYLLGSVHVLHADDRALPPVTEAAYLDAETLVEELNLFTVATEMASAAALAHQRLPSGQTLAGVLGPDLHRRLAATAAGVDLDAALMAGMQPWYAAITLTQQRLAKAGYSADHGVDYQIALRAQRDGKPIRGLETAVEQLAMLASMTLDEQVRFLEATLDESDTAEEMRAIAAAWRRGDLAGLDALIRQGVAESPGFFQRLITDRNLKWLPQIEAMLADASGDDYLVVAGAAHMLGESGLVELLRRKGYVIKRR